jgi:hypothetical protein
MGSVHSNEGEEKRVTINKIHNLSIPVKNKRWRRNVATHKGPSEFLLARDELPVERQRDQKFPSEEQRQEMEYVTMANEHVQAQQDMHQLGKDV